ncbi:CREA protein [Pelagivirga sediminicola]|uniref:CREA protein n=1 Tax=Pelagivirga sediminicola TaxID=2170575 RepID=A0A2T7GBS1_9RHOB|nr:CreA family protein [Pelagivirga sediminicola]PVA11880.1 CREA protein [Pelagivirga sediminicola]
MGLHAARATGAVLLAALLAVPAAAEKVGEIGVDWAGNDIVIEAINDPDVTGVTCHLAYFKRGLIDRLANGNWFEDPSNSAIECQQTGPITLGDIDRSKGGEDVFRASRSIIFKSLRVKRIYDKANNSLVYVAHGRELTQGSAKVSISTVPVGLQVTP